jgi:hypothetical protein
MVPPPHSCYSPKGSQGQFVTTTACGPHSGVEEKRCSGSGEQARERSGGGGEGLDHVVVVVVVVACSGPSGRDHSLYNALMPCAAIHAAKKALHLTQPLVDTFVAIFSELAQGLPGERTVTIRTSGLPVGEAVLTHAAGFPVDDVAVAFAGSHLEAFPLIAALPNVTVRVTVLVHVLVWVWVWGRGWGRSRHTHPPTHPQSTPPPPCPPEALHPSPTRSNSCLSPVTCEPPSPPSPPTGPEKSPRDAGRCTSPRVPVQEPA